MSGVMSQSSASTMVPAIMFTAYPLPDSVSFIHDFELPSASITVMVANMPSAVPEVNNCL